MTVMGGFFSSVFWGLVVLSLLVFVHEGGHFLAARAFGMRVTEFFLGLPCRWRLSFKSRRLGTEFGVTPFLLGGYNRICGMEGEQDPRLAVALGLVQEGGRIAVADVAARMGIEDYEAYGLMASLVDLGAIAPYYDPELDERPWQRDWPAAFQTQRRDANLLTEYDEGHDFDAPGTTEAAAPRPVDDVDAFLAQEVSHTYRGKGFVARLVTLLAGPLVNIVCAFVLVVGSFTLAGVEVISDTNQIADVSEGSLAEAAGLQPGDRITELGGQTVETWTELCEAIDAALAAHEDFSLTYERAGEVYHASVPLPAGEDVSRFGVVATLETYHYSLADAASIAFGYARFVAKTVARILMPTHTMEVVSQSSSIVGISAMASEAASQGFNELILLAASVSISLGFMNLLPIPPLDGGKIVIEFVQLALRRPLSIKAQNAVSYVGLAFFLFIFCFALRNDIVRILGL